MMHYALCLNRVLKQKIGFKDPFCLLAYRFKQKHCLTKAMKLTICTKSTVKQLYEIEPWFHRQMAQLTVQSYE